MHPTKPDRRMTGLGFIAVPVAALERLSEKIGLMKHGTAEPLFFHPFCCTGRPPVWWGDATQNGPQTAPPWCSEDFWLCLSLGGVLLAPVPAVHWKLARHVPSAEALRTVEQEFIASALEADVPHLAGNVVSAELAALTDPTLARESR